MLLRDVSEAELLARVFPVYAGARPPRWGSVAVGPGDDAAVVVAGRRVGARDGPARAGIGVAHAGAAVALGRTRHAGGVADAIAGTGVTGAAASVIVAIAVALIAPAAAG